MKKFIFLIIPIFFLSSCSSDDNPMDGAHNVIGNYETEYVEGREYVQTFYVAAYRKNYSDPSEDWPEYTDAIIQSICGRAFVRTVCGENPGSDKNQIRSKQINPELPDILKTAEANGINARDWGGIGIEYTLDYHWAMYFLVADIRFRYNKSTGGSGYSVPLDSRRLTNWRFVKGSLKYYTFNRDTYQKLVIEE